MKKYRCISNNYIKFKCGECYPETEPDQLGNYRVSFYVAQYPHQWEEVTTDYEIF